MRTKMRDNLTWRDYPIHVHIMAFCFLGIILIIPIAIYQSLTAPDPMDWRDGYAKWVNDLNQIKEK